MLSANVKWVDFNAVDDDNEDPSYHIVRED